jgi:hypothetical protein
MAPTHFQEQFSPKGEDVEPMGNSTTVAPGRTSVGSENGHGVPQFVGEGDNPVLESQAASKGKWFAYVKTKQFWVAMLLGQGKLGSPKKIDSEMKEKSC